MEKQHYATLGTLSLGIVSHKKHVVPAIGVPTRSSNYFGWWGYSSESIVESPRDIPYGPKNLHIFAHSHWF
jgi:hypothetical protein